MNHLLDVIVNLGWPLATLSMLFLMREFVGTLIQRLTRVRLDKPSFKVTIQGKEGSSQTLELSGNELTEEEIHQFVQMAKQLENGQRENKSSN
jgi:hypothetical protein